MTGVRVSGCQAEEEYVVDTAGAAEGRPSRAAGFPQPRPSRQSRTPAQYACQAGRPSAGLSHQLGQACSRWVTEFKAVT